MTCEINDKRFQRIYDVTVNRDLQEKSPTVQEVETVGQTFLFFRRF
jgi:hypothetical protein